MLKQAFALSDKGAKDLRKGIIATMLYNLALMFPIGLLMKLILEMFEVISGTKENLSGNTALYLGGTALLFVLIFVAQWFQYNKTYTVAYEESANRRIVIAEKLRKLPLAFFGKKNLSDLTANIMGDCTALERTFSNAIPLLFGAIFMFIFMSIGLLFMDWRMALCIIIPVPMAALIVIGARKAQKKAEQANLNAKRAAYDGVQEYLDTIQELKASSRENEYLEKLSQKLDCVVSCS